MKKKTHAQFKSDRGYTLQVFEDGGAFSMDEVAKALEDRGIILDIMELAVIIRSLEYRGDIESVIEGGEISYKATSEGA